MLTRPYLLHCLSPLHPGVGQTADVIDLPIARMRATGIPLVPGSSVKGVLRDARKQASTTQEHQQRVFAVFGPEKDGAAENAGALMVQDARLLALPVRSFRGTFAWVTSPLLLRLAHRDFVGMNNLPETPRHFDGPKASTAGRANVHGSGASERLYLEDLDLQLNADAALNTLIGAWGTFIANQLFPPNDREFFTRRFVVVDDETMTFLWETATQIDTRIRLDDSTRTVADGALWSEESLPPETLLVGTLHADPSRRKEVRLNEREVADFALASEAALQFGGKATVGRGRCRMIPLLGEAMEVAQ